MEVITQHAPLEAAARVSPQEPVKGLIAASRRVPTFGIAIFDNENSMTSGWACRSNGEPFPFSQPAELTNDAIWVTTVTWDEFTRNPRRHNLRRLDFLKTNILRVATDLGLRTDGAHARLASFHLARVIQNTVDIAATVYEWRDPGASITQDVLFEDIRRTLAQPPTSKPHIVSALSSAFQMSSSVNIPGGYEENTICLTLRRNRLAYFGALMLHPVPSEGWTVEMAGSELRRTAQSIDMLLDPSRPCLVEAIVETRNTNPEVAALLAFGSQGGRRSGGLRRWISQPELAWLVGFADVTVKTAYVSLTSAQLPDAVQLPVQLTADPMWSLSISAGLVAESHFQALASETSNRKAKAQGKIPSTWAVWMRAYDRAASFQLAYECLARGFTPLVYGGGAVTVKLQRDRLPELMAFAAEQGIAHPSLYPFFVEHGFVQSGGALPAFEGSAFGGRG